MVKIDNVVLFSIIYFISVLVVTFIYRILLDINEKNPKKEILDRINKSTENKVWKFHILIYSMILLILPFSIIYIIHTRFQKFFPETIKKLIVRYVLICLIVFIVTFVFIFPDKFGGNIIEEIFGVSEKSFNSENKKNKLDFLPSGENMYKKEFVRTSFDSIYGWFIFGIMMLLPTIFFTRF